MRREREAAEGTGKKKGKKGGEGEGTEQGSPSSDFTNWPLHSFAYNCFSFSVISLIIGSIAICIGSFYRFDLLLTYAAQNVWGLNTRTLLLIIVWCDFPIFIPLEMLSINLTHWVESFVWCRKLFYENTWIILFPTPAIFLLFICSIWQCRMEVCIKRHDASLWSLCRVCTSVVPISVQSVS